MKCSRYSRSILFVFVSILMLGSTWFLPSSATAAQPAKYVALTFDDGPTSKYTPRILASLKDAGVPATFFMNGKTISKNKALVRKVSADGHQVSSHMWEHKSMTRLSSGKNKKSIKKTNALILQITGQKNRSVRPPYGAMNKRVKADIKKSKMKRVLWSHDTLDWRRPGVKKIVSRATKKIRNGSIILMHDGGGNRSQTASAVPLIISKLKAQGYTFVTVDELRRLGLLH